MPTPSLADTLASHYAVDFKGRTNLLADIVPSCVGCVGLYIHEPADLRGTYDIAEYRFEGWVDAGTARPAMFIAGSDARLARAA